MQTPKLGILDEQLEDAVNFIAKPENIVSAIAAATGSGKSTNLIQKIFNHGSRVFISEPTIPAAENLYRYMGSRIGMENVGFAAEGAVKYNNNTKVVYCTSGHLRRKFFSYFEDGKVKGGKIDFCDVLALDEAHNGSLDYDVIMELWNLAYKQGAEIPRLVLLSATLDKDSTVFDKLPVYEIKVKGFPVTLEYANQDYEVNNKSLLTDMAAAVLEHNSRLLVAPDKTSKWMVFCPGTNEVEKIVQILTLAELPNVTILPAYSSLQREQIDKIFEVPELGTRTIIVATNIAEASITVDGLDGVFDTMLEKVQETAASGGSRLVLQNVAKSSADQRKGRTGRTNPGFCYRLITEEGYMKLKAQREREIFRVPLINVVIEMLDVGIDPTEIFTGRILEKKVRKTFADLKDLGMIDRKKNVTDKGHFAPEFPLSVYGSALIWEWTKLSKKDGSKYPVFPAVVVASLIDCYGPSYLFYPKKEYDQSDAEYRKLTDLHYKKYFKMYQSDTDLEVLLSLWNTVCGHFQTIVPNKAELAKWSNAYSLNNKKMAELFNIIKQSCLSLSRLNYDVVLGTFSEKNVIKLITPLLEDVYKNNVFLYQAKNKSYFNPETREYYKLNTRGSLTPHLPPFAKQHGKIVALSLAELPNKGGGPPTRLISLSQPV
jgi:HrpA-like RNA helicase